MDKAFDQEAQNIERRWQNYGGVWHPTTQGCPSSQDRDDISDQVIKLWRIAPNWSTMIELNLRYLTRRLPVCASYGQPPDIETDRFSSLLHLHEYGIISTNSCPGWEQSIHGSSAAIRQRAFLYFSLPTCNFPTVSPDTLQNFVQSLQNSSMVRALIRFQYRDAPRGVQRDPNIIGLMPYRSCDNLPEYDSHDWRAEDWDMELGDDGQVATFTFPYEQRRQDAKGDWADVASYDIETSGSSFRDHDDPFPASHAVDPLQIYVVARDWDFREIGELVKCLMDQSGILPHYGRRNNEQAPSTPAT